MGRAKKCLPALVVRGGQRVYALIRCIGNEMRSSAHLLVACFFVGVLAANTASAQKKISDPKAIVSAKTVYFEDKSGVDAVGIKALTELSRWGKYRIVTDQKKADLIVVLSTDPHAGGHLLLGGQTGSVDSTGHVADDSIPSYNKLEPVRHAFLTVVDAQSGKELWSDSERWGGLLTGFDSVGEHLVEKFEKEEQAAEWRGSLKLVKSVYPTYPEEARKKQVEGTVTVKVVVNKNGKIASAKAVSGPAELIPSSEEAAKQYEFEPPEHAPVTIEIEMTYGLGPKPCPPGKKGDHGIVGYDGRLPMSTGHPEMLKVVDEIDLRLPLYPENAREAGIEGDLKLWIVVAPSGEVIGVRVVESVDPEIDEAALAAVRKWKFKVTRGEAATFPIKISYRMMCD